MIMKMLTTLVDINDDGNDAINNDRKDNRCKKWMIVCSAWYMMIFCVDLMTGEFLGNSGSMEHASDVVSSKLSTQIVHLAQPDAITATTIHLRWDVRRSQRYIEGFHIKYCAVQNEGDDAERGPDLPPAVFAIQTIPNADSRVHILQGLEENTLYMIFLQPYYQLTEGAASNTIYAHTLEDGKNKD